MFELSIASFTYIILMPFLIGGALAALLNVFLYLAMYYWLPKKSDSLIKNGPYFSSAASTFISWILWIAISGPSAGFLPLFDELILADGIGHAIAIILLPIALLMLLVSLGICLLGSLIGSYCSTIGLSFLQNRHLVR